MMTLISPLQSCVFVFRKPSANLDRASHSRDTTDQNVEDSTESHNNVGPLRVNICPCL